MKISHVGKWRVGAAAWCAAGVLALAGCFSPYHDSLKMLETSDGQRLVARITEARSNLKQARLRLDEALAAVRRLSGVKNDKLDERREALTLQESLAELQLGELRRSIASIDDLEGRLAEAQPPPAQGGGEPAVVGGPRCQAAVDRLREAEAAAAAALAPLQDRLADWTTKPVDPGEIKATADRMADAIKELANRIDQANHATHDLLAEAKAAAARKSG